MKSDLYRTIDANYNRYQEGIRVAEDLLRYELNSPLSKRLKTLRHIRLPNYKEVIRHRDVKGDILKTTVKSEKVRENLEDIIIANLKRAQQSARVLEECYKIYDLHTSELFKNARYALYEIEKDILISND